MNDIVDSQKLNLSLKANNPKDARYGNGQYLSDIKPDTHTSAQLARNLLMFQINTNIHIMSKLMLQIWML